MGDTVASRRRQRVTIRDRMRRVAGVSGTHASLPLMPRVVRSLVRMAMQPRTWDRPQTSCYSPGAQASPDRRFGVSALVSGLVDAPPMQREIVDGVWGEVWTHARARGPR